MDQNKQLKLHKCIVSIILFLSINPIISGQTKQKIKIINYNVNKDFVRIVEKNLNKIIMEVNSTFISGDTITKSPTEFVDYGYNELKKIVKNHQIFFNEEFYERELIFSEIDNCYQVRDISVHINVNGVRLNSIQYLIFDFDEQGKIKNVKINSKWKELDFKEYDLINTQKIRYKIEKFLQDFTNAYFNKRIDYIEKVFHDNALIIVGHELKDNIEANEEIIEFNPNVVLTLKTKQQYLEKLEKVFAENKKIEVIFEHIEVKQKSSDPHFYGVTVFQRWNSDTYSDQGWLFLLLDFRDINNPILIHIRTWHPQYFRGRPPISIDDIKISPKKERN